MNEPNSMRCSSCYELGHARRTHRNCRLNPSNQNNEDENANPLRSEIVCSSCNMPGHSRRTSRLCSLNGQFSSVNIAKDPQAIPTSRDDQGSMNYSCPHCGALMWLQEKLGNSSQISPNFQLCCSKGNSILAPWKSTPPEISNLLRENDNTSKEFRKNIRSYNSSLSFTSLGVNLDLNLANERNGSYTFRVQGSPYHLIGSAIPPDGDKPKFAQIYIYDAEHELSNRHSAVSHVSITTLNSLQQLMHRLNPFVQHFKNMIEVANEQANSTNTNRGNNIGVDSLEDIKLVFRAEGLPDRRRYNRPTNESEIGVIIIGGSADEESNNTSTRDIVVRLKDNSVNKINEMNQFYDPLHYVLLFPEGDSGWNIHLYNISGNHKVTAMEYYSFRLMYRPQHGHLLHLFGKLFHQYIVDMYAKMEQNRLSYIRHNQNRLRSEHYQGLLDAVNVNDFSQGPNNEDLSGLGIKVILPSSFIGGPRHMAQLYQDALSIVRRFGKPDYFITFTCNPSWPEIRRELLSTQKASDRPDLCARVFNLKLRNLMNELTKTNILGKAIAYVYTIEFQKRGLPHAHILLIVDPQDKPQNTDDYDKTISAEIPDQSIYPLAYDTVVKNMIHGPCGLLNTSAVCMDPALGICTKQYPKDFSEETVTNENGGYPVYRRRNNGTVVAKIVQRQTVNIDNRWVVPHNLYLCTKYDAHVNVELCSSINSIKYVYKYVYKGHDRASMSVEQSDEIRSFIDARYVSAPESCWRLFSFPMHKEFPAHQRLAIHLEGENPVYFQEEDDIKNVLGRAMLQDTTLTGWFKTNTVDNNARTILYPNFPEQYVWRVNIKPNKWAPRQRGFGGTIGRIYAVSPRQSEKYHLRMLLYHVPGATSFSDLKTVNGIQHETFQDAARSLGLLTSDNQWDECLEEAAHVQTPVSLRKLFCIILVFCEPAYPYQLWLKFRFHLSEDYIYRAIHNPSNEPNTTVNVEEMAYNNSLLDIEDILVGQHGSSLINFSGFSLPDNDTRNSSEDTSVSRIIREQQQLNANAQATSHTFNINSFNSDQQHVYDSIMQCIENHGYESSSHPRIFFVDGPGGTGKTYLFNAILNSARSTQNGFALSVASSGTAALLLDGGRTAHSTFKIPLVVTSTTMCNIRPNSALADLLRLTKVIIWDEASMISKTLLEAVDRTFKDIFSRTDPGLESVPFGGRLMVFGGDFRQVLPVIPRGGRFDIVSQCINRSFLWRHVEVKKLRINMRVQQAQLNNNISLSNEIQQFADLLLNIGDGCTETLKLHHPATNSTTDTDYIRIPESMLIPGENVLNLLYAVYPRLYSLPNVLSDIDNMYFIHRAVLTPKNADVTEINQLLIERFLGEETKYLSADVVCDESQALLCPPEYLNSIESGSLPPHILSIKVGCPIMLLRNLDPSNGLCNGTRLIVKSSLRNIIEATISTGSHIGNVVCIPKIKVTASSDTDHIQFKRCQFPVRLAFAMIINKSQGQTLDGIGLYLPSAVFSHGQLYVALSRVKSRQSIKVLLCTRQTSLSIEESKNHTRNVVYSEVFDTPQI